MDCARRGYVAFTLQRPAPVQVLQFSVRAHSENIRIVIGREQPELSSFEILDGLCP